MNKDNRNNLKELKLWLCASLKNSEAQLICDSCSNDNDINNKIDMIINELEQLKIIINNINNNNNINKKNKNGGKCGRDRK